MKAHRICKHGYTKFALFGAALLTWALAGCTAIAPKPEQLQLPYDPPAASETAFSTALGRLGMQTEIYGARLFKIQCREMDDVTGTSYHSGGEIPRSITVMVKTALNAIGGQVVYIPYWPDYFAGIQVSGYPVSKEKLVPDVILAGGITEFDRGLVTVDKSRNADLETKEIDNAPDWFAGKTIGLDYSSGDKWSKAKIAVDFNLVSFEGQFGIPKMQASNGIMVYKGVKEGELGFTLFGPTIGLKGSVKKVQGRHDAVRFLVQFSVIQLVGRFLDLPYWQLLDGVQPDPVVLETLKTSYRQKDPASRIMLLKRLLWIHGHPVEVNDQLDAQTRQALSQVDPSYDGQTAFVPAQTYLKLYLSVPVAAESIEQGRRFDRLWAQFQAAKESKDLKNKQTPPQPSKPERLNKHKRPDQKTPKATEDQQETPRPEVIIITPLDTQTRHRLKRIIRRIEDKHKNSVGIQRAEYQSVSGQEWISSGVQ